MKNIELIEFRKEKRKKLFQENRPIVRQLELYDGEKYHKDIGILWVAYSKKPFYGFPPNMTQSEFADEIVKRERDQFMYMIEDRNKQFKEGGPVVFAFAVNDGWIFEPHAVFLPWATNRNKLRASISFFQWARHQKIGACLVKIIKSSKPLFDKCVDYGVLHYVGRVQNGDPRGDMYIYSTIGKCFPRTK